MKAQKLYDLKNEYEFCSGTDLHEFFRQAIGDPSPPGRKTIDEKKAKHFVLSKCLVIESNSNLSMDDCREALINS